MNGGPIRIRLAVRDPATADRLARLLGAAPGIALARPGDPADAVLSDPDDGGREAPPTDDIALTPREAEVLALLADGASNKAIANALGISVHTAKFHVGSLIDKLDAIGRTDAVSNAARKGVIDL